jgi:hypothetical protein
MTYTEILIDSAQNNICPGCGPTLINVAQARPSIGSQKIEWEKYCTCCGWHIIKTEDEYLFQSLAPGIPGTEPSFRCGLDHPEHRNNWPKPQADEDQDDDYDELESRQSAYESDPHHYNLFNREVVCALCSKWAAHKIIEMVQGYEGELYGTYANKPIERYKTNLCCNCFEYIFGIESHQYNRVNLGSSE